MFKYIAATTEVTTSAKVISWLVFLSLLGALMAFSFWMGGRLSRKAPPIQRSAWKNTYVLAIWILITPLVGFAITKGSEGPYRLYRIMQNEQRSKQYYRCYRDHAPKDAPPPRDNFYPDADARAACEHLL